MTSRLLLLLGIALLIPYSVCDAAPPGRAGAKTLAAFKSDAELRAYLLELRHETRRYSVKYESYPLPELAMSGAAVSTAAPAPSVTNTQHAGVDEGGIVKVQGDHLIVLRRGRLFTVKVGDGALRPVSAVDAFGPDIDPEATWYDELLVSNDTVVVIGYSYERGGTEIGIFDLKPGDQLSFRDTYHFRSGDYYSSRNYASRLIGSKLILYAPLDLWTRSQDPFDAMPAMRKWNGTVREGGFKILSTANTVYRPSRPTSRYSNPVLHSITTCDLAARALACQATGVIGESGRVFYVSPKAVYVWMSYWSDATWPTDSRRADRVPSMLYRLPLDGGAPSAIGTSGSPVDQFSFLEGGNGYLNVLVRAESDGDAMWTSEWSAGAVALMRIPVGSFGDGTQSAPTAWYQSLPEPSNGSFHNRFVGEFLLYGSGDYWHRPNPSTSESTLFAAHLGDRTVTQVPLSHAVDRIEVMGADAVVVGSTGKDLHFSGIRLDGRPARIQRYVLRNAAEGETRSHGFFYRAQANGGGVLGLPVRRAGAARFEHLAANSASILFLRNSGFDFQELGQLAAQDSRVSDDACRASCVDWYGNARPLFLQNRVLALLGYELVEGELDSGVMREVRRVNFAPGFAVAARE